MQCSWNQESPAFRHGECQKRFPTCNGSLQESYQTGLERLWIYLSIVKASFLDVDRASYGSRPTACRIVKAALVRSSRSQGICLLCPRVYPEVSVNGMIGSGRNMKELLTVAVLGK